ncbi:HAD family hydrolase [Kribbella sp. DT2]|uniref:HAD family hydrolase n=1 Tax=Kribbella sp. DT2 TaxID=3393427 RepID=UPI003CF3361F
MIDTLFFDGDNTLWNFDQVMRRSLHATLVKLREHRSAAESLTVDDLIADRQAVAAELNGTELNLERLRLAAFQRTLARLGPSDPPLAAELNAFYLDRRFADIELYPDTLPVLRALGTTYTIGLLSNGNSYPDKAGLEDLFDVVLFSQDLGVAKPDPAAYQLAAEKVDRPPSAIAMIGDSLPNDVTGPRAAGWTGIWLNRDGFPCPAGHAPDAVLGTLHELPGVLRS